MRLYVSPKEFSTLWEWLMLPEAEFLSKVQARYGSFPFGEMVQVIVDWSSKR
jgi:hypothetical protein